MRIISYNTDIYVYEIPSEGHFNKRCEESDIPKMKLGRKGIYQSRFHSLQFVSSDVAWREICIFLITEDDSFEPLIYLLNENDILLGHDNYVTYIDRGDFSKNKTVEIPFNVTDIIAVPNTDLLVITYETGISCLDRSFNNLWACNVGDIISELVWDNGKLRLSLFGKPKKVRYIDIQTGKNVK